jgi:hypothetical protein
MAQGDNYLHTTHRTVSWFNKTFTNTELELSPPFQRNPVWTDVQKAYLIDTILHGLPIPELYMQDLVDSSGAERHVVVDGQQRVRAVLDFIRGSYVLTGDDVTASWRGLTFEQLSADEKKAIFAYKFVVRVLPSLDEEALRRIFARLNRNVVALNEQELRNATYWGPFIKIIQTMADDDPFWSEAGIFSANDHRRMMDHEYISELAIAFLHGPQNKKQKLDHYYQLYEEQFEDAGRLANTFRTVTAELRQVVPEFSATRWGKKSDFYTLFLSFASKVSELPWPADRRDLIGRRIRNFGERVDRLLRLEETAWGETDKDVENYPRNVARAASDRANRIARQDAFARFVFEDAQPDLLPTSAGT